MIFVHRFMHRLGIIDVDFPGLCGTLWQHRSYERNKTMGIVGIAFIVGQLISMGSLMGAHSSAIYAESIRRLRAPMIANAVLSSFSLTTA